MRTKTDLFLIDGQPMLAPDENLQITAEDVEAVDSVRDESGFLHRFVARQAVETWNFSYDYLTGEEYAYMEQLFAGKETFRFTCPDCGKIGDTKVITACRAEHGIQWQSAATGQFRNYKFRIMAC